MLRKALLFLLVVGASWTLTQGYPQESITLCGGLGSVGEGALKAEGVALHRDGAILVLEVSDRQAAIRALGKALVSLEFRKSVAANNIANKDSTMTANGLAYRRQYAVIDDAGGVLGVTEDGGDFNWIYDPSNPYALKDGPHRGYVPHPNVDVLQETTDVARWDRDQEAIRLVLRRLDPELIISPSFAGVVPNLTEPGKFLQPVCTGHPSIGLLRNLDFNGVFSKHDMLDALDIDRFDRDTIDSSFNNGPFDSDWLVRDDSSKAAGPASVASSLNWILRGPRYSAETIQRQYGGGLLNALKSESSAMRIDWHDAGNLSKTLWPRMEATLSHGLPVIMAFNGPLSPRSEGQVVMLTEINGERVTYADPYTGKLVTVTKQALLTAESHPDGNFVFLPSMSAPFSHRSLGAHCMEMLKSGTEF